MCRPYGQIGTFRGGRVRTPAPTMYPKVRSIFCRARCPQRADSGRSGVPPLTSAACGRTVCAPTEKKKKRAVNDLWERESPAASRHPLFDNGGFGRRAFFRSKSCLSREHPHPPPSGAPSPLKGEGLRAAARVAPTAKTDQERWLGKLRRRPGTAPRTNFANSGPSGPAGS